MNFIADMLTFLGRHFVLVIIGGIEIVAAIIMLSTYLGRKLSKEKSGKSYTPNVRGVEQEFLNGMKRRKGEVCLIVRCADHMPVYEVGDINDMLGVNLEKLQEDIINMKKQMKYEKDGERIWQKYIDWDGTESMDDEFQLKNDNWIRMSVIKSEDKLYDLTYFWSTTGYHELIEQIEDKRKLAEEASVSKTKFLSRMSHEIRTPMNGIIGMLTLAKSKVDLKHPVVQYLDKAEELSDHMLSLINDILDMSRIEAGKVELEEKPFSIRELGNKLYDMFAKNLENRGIRYEIIYEKMTVDMIIGDELRISQVIINFLSNAVKFTSKGEITVTFRQMMLKDGIMDLLVRVHDTGIGMDADFLKRIFQPFEQESIETSKQYGGSGLGMAISDNLVKLMGGEIVVESMKGEGSDFFVYLHMPVVEGSKWNEDEYIQVNNDSKEKKRQIKKEAFRGKRILMAEDNEINAMIAVEILEEMGAKVDLADNGQIAVNKFKMHPAKYYDFILMDVQMPVMDGRTASRTIRALDRFDAKEIPIFALSADAFVEDERLSLESGMNGHFAKPLDFNVLQDKIGMYLSEE